MKCIDDGRCGWHHARSFHRKSQSIGRMFVRPELECGGQDVEKTVLSWECEPESEGAVK